MLMKRPALTQEPGMPITLAVWNARALDVVGFTMLANAWGTRPTYLMLLT